MSKSLADYIESSFVNGATRFASMEAIELARQTREKKIREVQVKMFKLFALKTKDMDGNINLDLINNRSIFVTIYDTRHGDDFKKMFEELFIPLNNYLTDEFNQVLKSYGYAFKVNTFDSNGFDGFLTLVDDECCY